MDDHAITPRRALPPVPPPGRQSGTATLTPALDQTSWFDPLDPINDSAIHPALHGLDPLDDGTAAKAARDLIRESGRQPVLDEALLEALDAAAKAAEARRAVTVTVPPTTAAAPAVPAPASPVVVPAPPVVAAPPAVPAPPVVAAPPGPVVAETVVDEPALDVSAEFARHDDLVETGRHAALDDEWVYDSGPQAPLTETGRHLAVELVDDDDGDDAADDPAPTHRTVVTRSSGRRWIPAGVGAAVVTIVGAVLLTSGFGADARSAGTDEAARTGASTSDSATPAATTPALPTPAMNTLDLSGPVLVDTEDVTQPTVAGTRSSSAVQPRVTASPARTTAQASTGGGNSGGSGDAGTAPSTDTATGTGTTTTTLTTETPATTPSISSSESSSSSSSISSDPASPTT